MNRLKGWINCRQALIKASSPNMFINLSETKKVQLRLIFKSLSKMKKITGPRDRRNIRVQIFLAPSRIPTPSMNRLDTKRNPK
jgi:hypothetical protein